MQQGQKTKSNGEFQYLDQGEGTPIIILHGLMGGLAIFRRSYPLLTTELPRYYSGFTTHELPLLKTTVKSFAEYIDDFINT